MGRRKMESARGNAGDRAEKKLLITNNSTSYDFITFMGTGGSYYGSINGLGEITLPKMSGTYVASGNLTLDSTTSATKGNIFINPLGGRVGIGTTNPQDKLDINGNIRVAKNAAQPYACDAAHDAVLAITSGYRQCICNGGTTTWVFTSDGVTACSW